MWDRIRQVTLGRVALTSTAPHARTSRCTYTLPTYHQGTVRHIHLFVQRTTAPSTAGETGIELCLTPSGGTETTIAKQRFSSSTVGAASGITFTDSVYLRPGDTLTVYTYDSSTGGACDYIAAVQVLEWR